MRSVQQGIAERIVFIGIFNGGFVKHHAFINAISLGKRACGDVAHDDFQRHNLHPAHKRITRIELLYKVIGNPHFGKAHHQAVVHLIVDCAFARNGALLQTVEGSSVILIGYDQQIRILGFIYALGFSFVELIHLVHSIFPPICRYAALTPTQLKPGAWL